MPEPGPSGDRQLAPGTAIQWEASLTDELVTALPGRAREGEGGGEGEGRGEGEG